MIKEDPKIFNLAFLDFATLYHSSFSMQIPILKFLVFRAE